MGLNSCCCVLCFALAEDLKTIIRDAEDNWPAYRQSMGKVKVRAQELNRTGNAKEGAEVLVQLQLSQRTRGKPDRLDGVGLYETVNTCVRTHTLTCIFLDMFCRLSRRKKQLRKLRLLILLRAKKEELRRNPRRRKNSQPPPQV